jgi:ribulose-phosphate 3-epimerase
MQPLVAPSLLAFDLGRMADEVRALEAAGADVLHLDVMDGHFVPNLTFGFPVIEALRKVTTLPFDAHLMVSNPDDHLDEYARVGCNWISVHVETCSHLHRTLGRIRELGMKAGVAINPGTSLASLDAILTPGSPADFILLMTVNPGFAGQKFVAGGMERIAKLRALVDERVGRGNIRIEVDGSLKTENAADAVRAGAEILVVGSGIAATKDWKTTIAALKGSGSRR